ncbi:hypothetical protein I7I48_08005 [Histoplasma ohiense]|nr:hypothetical protein I7I48_08005 [Histoplasma ohiense (nom. inval.)]
MDDGTFRTSAVVRQRELLSRIPCRRYRRIRRIRIHANRSIPPLAICTQLRNGDNYLCLWQNLSICLRCLHNNRLGFCFQ